MTQNKEKIIKRRFQGIVVSDKMDKTCVVKIERTKMHKKYGKTFVRSRKFKAHDEKNMYKVGDIVVIEEFRPMSRDKRFRVVEKVK